MSDRYAARFERVLTRFGSHVVHRDLDLDLREGEILGLVGGSGSGKTTLLRLLLGLEKPARGRVFLFDEDLAVVEPEEQERLRGRCGVLFQSGALFTALSVFENVALPLRELRLFGDELIGWLVRTDLSLVGLGDEAAALVPAELSGGMVKRVALARALAPRPRLLLLDEPTSGLDPISGDAFVRLVRSLHHELGFTALLITHDLDTLVDLCDRIAVLADQRIVATGTLDEVVANPHPYVRDFFHTSRAERVLRARDEERS